MSWDWEKALGIAVVAGLFAVIIAALFVGGPDGPVGAPRPVVLSPAPGDEPASTPSSIARAADTADWYQGTSDVRATLSSTATLVRRYVAENNGVSLEPVCVDFATQAEQARSHPDAPDRQAQKLWSDGLFFYVDAATACGQLFDGTQVPVGVLQERATAALDDADEAWAELARLVVPPPSALPR